MKKLYIILGILNIVSIILLFQIIFGLIPSFECDYPVDKIDKINSLIVDLSIGVITSTFFYYILVYIPEKRKEKVIRSIISNDLLYIANNMQMVLAYVVKIYSLEVKDKYYRKIPQKELLKIKNETHTKFETICSFNVEINPSILVENSASINTDVNSLNYTAKEILERIKNINNIPNIISEDEILISTLDKISRCSFYTNTNSIDKKSKDLFGNDYERLSLIFNFHSIRELHSLYVTLTKYITPYVFSISKN
jgi:hypothetical protein